MTIKKTTPKKELKGTRKLDSHTKLLECKLTDKELLDCGQSLGKARQDIAQEESRQVDVKAELKARLARLEAISVELTMKITRKEEFRDVTVERTQDFDINKYYETRSDTLEQINERPITDDERQENLDIN